MQSHTITSYFVGNFELQLSKCGTRYCTSSFLAIMHLNTRVFYVQLFIPVTTINPIKHYVLTTWFIQHYLGLFLRLNKIFPPKNLWVVWTWIQCGSISLQLAWKLIKSTIPEPGFVTSTNISLLHFAGYLTCSLRTFRLSQTDQ